jgi:hypothetical protein
MPQHVEIVFKQLFEELKSMKQQQWTITNYGVLILAAIYAVKQLPVSHGQSKLQFLAIMTAVFGSLLLLRIQCGMTGPRWRLDEVHKTYFTPDELRGVGFTDKQIQKLQTKPWRRKLGYLSRGLEFTGSLMAILWVGAILVCLTL